MSELKLNAAIKELATALNQDFVEVEISELCVERKYGESVATAAKKVAKFITKNTQLAVDMGSQERAIAWEAKKMGAFVQDAAIDAIREAIN